MLALLSVNVTFFVCVPRGQRRLLRLCALRTRFETDNTMLLYEQWRAPTVLLIHDWSVRTPTGRGRSKLLCARDDMPL